MDANIAVIREFGWHQVAIITENANLFIEVSTVWCKIFTGLAIDKFDKS